MDLAQNFTQIRKFITDQIKDSVAITTYQLKKDPQAYFTKLGINVRLEQYKDIILQEETRFELGGVDKQSFLLIYPTHLQQFIEDGEITIIGSETDALNEDGIDFGLFILIGFEKINEKEFNNLKHLSFVSNSIEGFMIRTIPRRFWCRITAQLYKNFSFEFLANAIHYLYRQEFGAIIKKMEILMIIEEPHLIEEFNDVTAKIQEDLKFKWKEKINEWKKRVDCDYDWECAACPYYDACVDIREVLEEREKIDE